VLVELRLAIFWLTACSLAVGYASAEYRWQLLGDVDPLAWLDGSIVLFVVAACGIRLWWWPASRSSTIAVLIVGSLAAAASTHEFLRSRIRCINIQIALEYALPDEIGPLVLFGPIILLVVLAVIRRPTVSYVFAVLFISLAWPASISALLR